LGKHRSQLLVELSVQSVPVIREEDLGHASWGKSRIAKDER
jgi:hypothetical protein